MYQPHCNAAIHTCKAFKVQVYYQCKAVAQGKSKEYSCTDESEWT